MASDTVWFCDPNASGNESGSNWENAITSLDTAVNKGFDGYNTTIYVRNSDPNSLNVIPITSTIVLDTAGGSSYYNKWKKIIGCHATQGTGTTPVPLEKGEYVKLTGEGQSLGAPLLQIDPLDCLYFRHLWFADCYDSGSSNEHGVYSNFGSAGSGYVFRECKFSGNYRGFYSQSNKMRSVIFLDCDFVDNQDYDSYCSVYEAFIIGCRYYATSPKSIAVLVTLGGSMIRSQFSGPFEHCFIKYSYYYDYLIMNCSARGFTVAAIDVFAGDGTSSYGAGIVDLNNVWVAADSSTDNAIYNAKGIVPVTDYNLTNVDTYATGQGTENIAGDSIQTSLDIDLVDPTNGDFNIRQGKLLYQGYPFHGEPSVPGSAVHTKYEKWW